MKIECRSVDSFLANLRVAPVYGLSVWLDKTRRPAGGKRDAAAFEVAVHASAVLELGDGQALLLYGEECGMDWEDQGGDLSGTARCEEVSRAIVEFCEGAGLVVRPGVLSE